MRPCLRSLLVGHLAVFILFHIRVDQVGGQVLRAILVELVDECKEIGFGRVGRLVSQRALAFGMNVVAYDPFVSEEIAAELNIGTDSLVFIDGQTDFYGEALTREYEQVITMDENWEQILEKYQVDWMIVPEGSILADNLNEQAAWQTIYSDDTAVIFKNGD